MVGVSAAESVPDLAAILRSVQHELFNLESILATKPEDVHPNQARITAGEIQQLEREIDRMNAELAPLRSFVLAGGARRNTEVHGRRAVFRPGGRIVVCVVRGEGSSG